jgi:general secretion pathway protein F
MPVYEYTAINSKGKNLKGIINADSAAAARQKLRDTEIYPVKVNETSAKLKDSDSLQLSISDLFKRVRPVEVSVMTRQLSILLGAGLPLISSLETLLSQISNPLLKKIMAQVKESVNEGNSLASSLSQYPKQFSQIYVNMVRAGEESGSLDLVLEQLADFSENQESLKGRISAALVYPVMISTVGVGVLFVMMTFIVPSITEIFTEMEQTLPLPTLILIAISKVFKSFWWVMLIGVIILITVLRRFIKTQRGMHLWDDMKIRAPLFGRVNIKLSMARFGRTLGNLLQSGVPLLQALSIVQNVVNNSLIAETIEKAMDEIKSGKNLSSPLSQGRLIPPVAIQMIAVGEQSGELEKMLFKIADIYEKETESNILALTSMLEPIMILVMALAVACVGISILLPILQMTQMIQ